jgi:ferrous iron transport protein B
LYLFGIALAVGLAKLLRVTAFEGSPAPFVMEMPPYRFPSLRDVAIHTWERAWLYIKKAGTVILGISILLWGLTRYPALDESYSVSQPNHSTTSAENQNDSASETRRLEYSFAGRIGHAMAPLLAPLGFDWQIGTAMIGAFAAKEVFVAQMGIVCAANGSKDGDGGLRAKLRERYTPLSALCVMVFCLVGTPCMATLAVVRKETGSWKWAMGQWAGLTILAYGLTWGLFQSGRFFGF